MVRSSNKRPSKRNIHLNAGRPLFMHVFLLFFGLSFLFSVCDGKRRKNFFSCWKNDFDQQTACRAPVCRSKYTTQCASWSKNWAYILDASSSDLTLLSSSLIACFAWISDWRLDWRLSSSIFSSFCDRRFFQFFSGGVVDMPLCFRYSNSSVIFEARACR